MTKEMERRVFAELYYFLESLPKEEKATIPEELINLIIDKKDDNYFFDEDSFEESFLEETNQYISLIYTDYLASDDEKKIILAKEKMTERSVLDTDNKKNSLEELDLKKDKNNLDKQENSIMIIDESESSFNIFKKIKEFVYRIIGK